MTAGPADEDDLADLRAAGARAAAAAAPMSRETAERVLAVIRAQRRHRTAGQRQRAAREQSGEPAA